jgi:CHASE3 domain sensor protein
MRLFSSETSNEIDALPSERTFRKLLWGAILWPAGTLCVVVALLVVLVLHLYRAAGWLDHSDQVISQVWTTEKMAVDMETGLRAYQLTNAPAFLEPWNEAESRIGGSFDSLAGLVADNPSQSMATTESRELFERWRSFATETLNRMKSGGDIRSAEWNARGKGLFDAFRERMDRFIETEEQLRIARERSYEELRRAVMSALIAAGLIGAPFLAWRFFAVSSAGSVIRFERHLRRRMPSGANCG